MKRFGQDVLQVELCSLDAIIQIFKMSICPGTPFFEFLARRPPATMDDLFKSKQVLHALGRRPRDHTVGPGHQSTYQK